MKRIEIPFGTDITGTSNLGGVMGLWIYNADNNIIGGSTPGARNLISGNWGEGIEIFLSSGNTVQGNLIGTDITGTANLGNGAVGIDIGASDNNIIGGSTPGARNLISGNGADGIAIFLSSGNIVQGNFVGTDITGTAKLGNGYNGIDIDGSEEIMIGGIAPGAGNLISGNNRSGIYAHW